MARPKAETRARDVSDSTFSTGSGSCAARSPRDRRVWIAVMNVAGPAGPVARGSGRLAVQPRAAFATGGTATIGGMFTLDERLATIFEAILETYDRQPPDRRRRSTHHRSFQRESFLEWDDRPAVTRD